MYCLGSQQGCDPEGGRWGGSRKDRSPNELQQIPPPRSLVELGFPQSFSVFFLFSYDFLISNETQQCNNTPGIES